MVLPGLVVIALGSVTIGANPTVASASAPPPVPVLAGPSASPAQVFETANHDAIAEYTVGPDAASINILFRAIDVSADRLLDTITATGTREANGTYTWSANDSLGHVATQTTGTPASSCTCAYLNLGLGVVGVVGCLGGPILCGIATGAGLSAAQQCEEACSGGIANGGAPDCAMRLAWYSTGGGNGELDTGIGCGQTATTTVQQLNLYAIMYYGYNLPGGTYNQYNVQRGYNNLCNPAYIDQYGAMQAGTCAVTLSPVSNMVNTACYYPVVTWTVVWGSVGDPDLHDETVQQTASPVCPS